MRHLLKKAFSTQTRTSYVHNKEDNVLIFGAISAIFSLVTGAFMLLYFAAQDIGVEVRFLGLLWMVYSGLILVGVELFERTKKKEAAVYLIILGATGFFFGVGFYFGSLMTVFTGYLALRYHIGLHKK